jgi:GcrA cell cycle regulator
MTEEEKIAKPKPVRRLPMTGPTLPPLSVTAQPQNMPGMRFCTLKLKDEPLPVAFRRRSAGVSDLPCSWPLGEPGKPGFRFCDEPVMPGRQYCGPHCERAYVRPERIKVVARDVSA